MPTVLLLPPPESKDPHIVASAPTVYVVTAPEGATDDERRAVAEVVGEAAADVHSDGSPHSWTVVPFGWRRIGGRVGAGQSVGRVASVLPDGWALEVIGDG
jgi:hypothetical protein